MGVSMTVRSSFIQASSGSALDTTQLHNRSRSWKEKLITALEPTNARGLLCGRPKWPPRPQPQPSNWTVWPGWGPAALHAGLSSPDPGAPRGWSWYTRPALCPNPLCKKKWCQATDRDIWNSQGSRLWPTVGAVVVHQDDLCQQPVDEAANGPFDDRQSFIQADQDDADVGQLFWVLFPLRTSNRAVIILITCFSEGC